MTGDEGFGDEGFRYEDWSVAGWRTHLPGVTGVRDFAAGPGRTVSQPLGSHPVGPPAAAG